MITQSELLDELCKPLLIPSDGFTFPKLIEEFSYMGENYIRNKIIEFFEYIDYQFRYSPGRTNNYYVRDYKPRTIITMFGEITYNRTIYTNRITGKRYTYVDERLGIGKRLRYTNDVAAYVAEAYSDENSMIKVGIEVGNLIHSKFSLKDNRIYAIPRQTISNLMKRVKEIRICPENEKKEIDELYVLMDEKHLPDHAGKKSTMVKSALIVEGLDKEDKKRHKYINPMYYTSYSSTFADDLLNFIGDRYDLDSIKHIHVLADGAKWIKTVSNDLKLSNTSHTNYLDKFHYSQAMWRITSDNDVYKIAMSYLYNNDKTSLLKLFKSIREDEKEDTNMKYIKNNWEIIQNMIHLENMNCAMEQCISHHIHSQFDNVPKVYSKDNINRYLSLRDNYRNKENIKDLFLRALDDDSDSDITIINKFTFNYEDFDKQIPLPYHTTQINTGKKLVSFVPHPDFKFIF